jgi:hypothetical protein
MKYVRNFSSFKKNKKETINEEFIGGLLKNLFNKAKQSISMSYSKQFGTASKADKIIADYQAQAIEAQKSKLVPLKALAEYIKNVKAGGEPDEKEAKKLESDYKNQEVLYTKQLEKMKEIFNAKLEDVVEEEDNKKIKNYIKIKKLEMEEQLLLNELKLIQQDVGMTDQQIKDDPIFKVIMENLTKRTQENEKQQNSEKEILDSKESTEEGSENKFDFEKAKNDRDYKGPLTDSKFSVGEEITYYSTKAAKKSADYKGTTAFVYARKEGDEDNQLTIALKENDEANTFTISKSRVITTKKIEDEKAKKSEESDKKESEETTTT